MIIYGSTMSPFVRKTVVFATEKGCDFEMVMAGAQGGPPEFKAASPFRQDAGLQGRRFPDLGFHGDHHVPGDDQARAEPDPDRGQGPRPGDLVRGVPSGDTIVAACGGKIFFNRVVSSPSSSA